MQNQGRVDQFIENVLQGVQFKEAHADIKKELQSHFEEAKDQIEPFGQSGEKIEATLIERMGSTEELGRKFNEVHKSKTDWILLSMMVALLGFGLFSAAQTGHFVLQAVWAFVGASILTGIYFLKPAVIRDHSFSLLVASMVVWGLSFFSNTYYDGQPYLALGPIRIKITDFIVVPMVISIAGILTQTKRWKFPSDGFLLLAPLVPVAGLIATGAIYSALLLAISVLAMLVASRWSTLWISSYLSAAVVLFFALLKPTAFLGAEQFQALLQTERHTDFAFSSLRETLPLMGILVAIVSMCMAAYLLSKVQEIKNYYLRTLFVGSSTVVGVGLLWGLASNLGYLPMPTTGVNFPFLSYGGSMLVGHMILVGINGAILKRKSIFVIS